MIRKNFYLTVEQNDFLKKFKGLTVSEHIRRALDEYIARHASDTAVQSPSQKTKGGTHGS